MKVEGESKQIGKGDICSIERGKKFSYENTSGSMAILALVHTPPFDLNSEVTLNDDL